MRGPNMRWQLNGPARIFARAWKSDKRRVVNDLMNISPFTAEIIAVLTYALGSTLAASRPAIRPKIMHSAFDDAPWYTAVHMEPSSPQM